VLDAVAGARAAVVAGRPAAIFEADLVEGVAPVLPEEVLVQARREVVPREHLVFGAVANKTLKFAVGTVKKSHATMSLTAT
jgi:hypothetical protein